MPVRPGCTLKRSRRKPPPGVPSTPPIIQVEILPALALSPEVLAAFKRLAVRVWETMQHQAEPAKKAGSA